MHILRSIVILIAFILAPKLRAENSVFTAGYIQFSNGRFCDDIGKDDLVSAGLDCGPKGHIDKLRSSYSELFDRQIFNLAAEKQIKKNKCLAEQIEVLAQNKKNRLDIYYSNMALAWLGMKKSKMIVDKCNAEVLSRLEAADVNRLGTRQAFEKARRASGFSSFRAPVNKKWLDICLDDDQMSSLRAATHLFQHSLPVISDPELFAELEKNREIIINNATGKPFSDSEIMAAKLQKKGLMSLQISEVFEEKIKAVLLSRQAERQTISSQIEKSKTDGVYRVNSELKNFIVQDDTLNQVLESLGAIPADYVDLPSTSPEEISAGAFCLLSWHEKHLKGEIFGFAAESALWGGLLLKLLRNGKAFSELSKLGQIKQATGYGFMVTGVRMTANQILKSCPVPFIGDEAHKAKKVLATSKTEYSAERDGKYLPEDVGFRRWNIKMDPEDIPSCQDVEQKNSLLNSNYNSNCLLDALLEIAPLKLALPILLVQ